MLLGVKMEGHRRDVYLTVRGGRYTVFGDLETVVLKTLVVFRRQMFIHQYSSETQLGNLQGRCLGTSVPKIHDEIRRGKPDSYSCISIHEAILHHFYAHGWPQTFSSETQNSLWMCMLAYQTLGSHYTHECVWHVTRIHMHT